MGRFEPITCACGCGATFTPWIVGMQFKRGHKPHTGPPGSPAKADGDRILIDFTGARAILAQQLRFLDAKIESCDDEMEPHRAAIAHLQAVKDAAVLQHTELTVVDEWMARGGKPRPSHE